jgi:hypothetical protein
MIKYIDNLGREELIAIYGSVWQWQQGFSDDALRRHIKVYIIQFYILRNIKESCRKKARLLLEMVRERGEKKIA